MKLASLNPGDTIECSVRGTHFLALYKGADDNGLVKIEPLESKHYSWRRVTARQVVRQVEMQERLGVAA